MLEKFVTTLSADDSKILEQYVVPKEALRGTVLLEAGDTTRDVYFMISGSCDIYQSMPHTGHTLALKIASLEAPLVLGEANMFLGDKRNASVLLSADTKYLFLAYEKIIQLKEDHPDIYTKILEYGGEIMSARYIQIQAGIQKRILENTDSPAKALAFLRIMMGSVTVCSPSIAKKLFGTINIYSED